MNKDLTANLNQCVQKIDKIFEDKDVNLFLKKLLDNTDYWSIITAQQKEEIEEIINSMVANARQEATRKVQQEFFYPTLTALSKPDVKQKFMDDASFRGSVITLSIIFLAGFHEMNHKDSGHHDFIAKNLKQSLAEIIK